MSHEPSPGATLDAVMRTQPQPTYYPARKVRAAGMAGIMALSFLALWTFRAWITGGNVQVTIGPLLGGVFVFCVMIGTAYWCLEESR